MGWLSGSQEAQSPPPSPSPPSSPPPQGPQKPKAHQADNSDPEMRQFLQELMGEVKSMRDADAAADAAAAAAAAAAASKPSDPASANTNTKKLPVSPWGSRWASSSMSGPTPAYSPPTTAPSSSATTTTPEDPDNPNNAPRLSPLAESLLPTTMTCMSALDLAYECASLGGQFRALYRYGAVRSCTEQWDSFWFCMRAKGFGEGKVKQDAIRDHYRQKELAKYGPGKPSSEDVWRERRERVRPGEAFSMPLEMPTVGDAELQKWEMERMQRIRMGLSDGDGS